MRLAAAALLFLVAICALSTASARRGLAVPSLRLRVSRPPPLALPAPLSVAAKPRSAPVTAAARQVCAGALLAASLLFGLSTPSSAASDPSTTRSPPASVTTPLPPRLSSWDFGGRLQRLEDTAFTKEDAREMEAERKKENKEIVLSGLLLLGTVTAILRQDTTSRMDLMEAVRKKEAEQLKVDMEAKEKIRKDEMKVMAETTQRNFMTTTFFTVVSLAISLAANKDFMAKVFPPQ